MRVRADASYGEVYAAMTSRQQDAMDEVAEAARQVRSMETMLRTKQARLEACVYEAVGRGVPARIVAERLGLSISRVYQIRDQVARWRDGR